MGQSRKKLQRDCINRNNSTNISHTINKIKENEVKYTIILVIIFISIFVILGYNFLSIDNYELFDNTIKKNNYFSISNNLITLTNSNIGSEEVNSKENIIHIINNTNFDKNYKIYFKTKDYIDESILNRVRYSIDGKNIFTLNDNLFTSGIIKKGEKKDIFYNIWISDEDINLDDNFYLNGYFTVIEENNE